MVKRSCRNPKTRSSSVQPIAEKRGDSAEVRKLFARRELVGEDGYFAALPLHVRDDLVHVDFPLAARFVLAERAAFLPKSLVEDEQLLDAPKSVACLTSSIP